MYDSQTISERIKDRAKSNKIALKVMLADCGLGINTISHMAHGQTLASDSLARIADYLDCSVDYLLGRTDEVEINHGGSKG